MIENSKPQNYGNANFIVEQKQSECKLTMLKYENTFDFYSEEPSSILIKKENNKEWIANAILRIRIWHRKNQSYSWSVYANDRHEFNKIVIRKVVWDMDKDIENARVCANKDKKKLLILWPFITTFNKFISACEAANVIEMIKNLDSTIEKGIILYENKNPTWEWRDIEVFRLYDWGQVHAIWNTNKKNEEIEKKVKKLISILNLLIEKTHDNIYSMSLNYSINPEKYKEVYMENTNL